MGNSERAAQGVNDSPIENANASQGHNPPPVSCLFPDSSAYDEPIEHDPVIELGRALYPYSLYQYRGRLQAMADSLGLARSSYMALAKPSGAKRLGLRVVSAAAKICEAKISELSAILVELRARERKLAQTEGKPRGFLVVRVRDSSGIPRNAQGNGRGNEPGF